MNIKRNWFWEEYLKSSIVYKIIKNCYITIIYKTSMTIVPTNNTYFLQAIITSNIPPTNNTYFLQAIITSNIPRGQGLTRIVNENRSFPQFRIAIREYEKKQENVRIVKKQVYSTFEGRYTSRGRRIACSRGRHDHDAIIFSCRNLIRSWRAGKYIASDMRSGYQKVWISLVYFLHDKLTVTHCQPSSTMAYRYDERLRHVKAELRIFICVS